MGVAVRGDVEAGDIFRRTLETFRTDEQADHNYSVFFSSDRRAFHRLQWGGCTVVRTRDPKRFGQALALHLSGHGSPPAGLLRSDGVVAIRHARATVLPETVRQEIPRYERPLREAEVLLHDAPWVDFDPVTRDIALEESPLAPSFFDTVVNRLPPGPRPEPTLAPGRYPLAAWYFALGRPTQPMAEIDAVAALLSQLHEPIADRRQLRAAATMFEQMPFGRRWFASPSELLGQIST